MTVNKGGAPLADAEVLVGDVVGSVLTTDEDGLVGFLVDDGFAAYVHVLITKEPDTQVVAYQRIAGGGDYTIDIPS